MPATCTLHVPTRMKNKTNPYKSSGWSNRPMKHVFAELNGKIDHERLGMQTAPLDYIERAVREALAGR
jgi:hypothetical protein